jgi:hypothetical protein
VQESDTQLFPPGSYIVSFIRRIGMLARSKKGEPDAEEGDEYVFVTFMEKTSGGRRETVFLLCHTPERPL